MRQGCYVDDRLVFGVMTEHKQACLEAALIPEFSSSFRKSKMANSKIPFFVGTTSRSDTSYVDSYHVCTGLYVFQKLAFPP
jgi:hypothetical protein